MKTKSMIILKIPAEHRELIFAALELHAFAFTKALWIDDKKVPSMRASEDMRQAWADNRAFLTTLAAPLAAKATMPHAECPPEMQMAARRGGIVVNAAEVNKAVQMMRAAAVVELMQEAQKEKSTVSAYKRVQKALRLLGINDADAVNLILYALEYHTREGKPHKWLAQKLRAGHPRGLSAKKGD